MAISSAALNGTTSSAKYQSVYLEFWQVSQSVENNQTTFGYKAYMKSNVSGANGNTGYGHYTFTGATSIAKVSNQTWSWNYTTSQLIKEGTFTKTHNPDGTLANQTLTVTAGGSTSLGYATVSVTLPVATIPRATTPTVNYTTRDMGQPIVITINGASTAFTHNLYYAFPGIGTTFITTVAAGTTSYSWAIPTATLAPNIPNATSGTVTITAETLSGTTVIGTKTTTFTATVPASVIPTIDTTTASEAVAGLASQIGAFIQGRSKLNVGMTASGIYGSTISSYSITANGQTFSASSGTTDFLNTAGTNTITYRVTDSRGRSASATLNVTVLAYAPPQIHTFRVERVNASGVVDATGDRVKATYAITVASLGGRNSKSYELKYKTSTDSAYTSIWLDATSFTPNTAIIPGVVFSTSYIYNFQLAAYDYFEVTPVTGTVYSGFVPAHFRAGGKGVGIGMRATKDALQVGLPAEFNFRSQFTDGVSFSTKDTTGSHDLSQIEIREANFVTGTQSTIEYSPTIDFHWGGVVARQLSLNSQGDFIIRFNSSILGKLWHGGNSNVMETSGSNANGSYIRFSDGTQICFGEASSNSQSFPAVFSVAPHVVITPISSNEYQVLAKTYSVTNSLFEVRQWWLFNGSWAVAGDKIPWIAIGKWK